MSGRHVPIFAVALGASLLVHAGMYTGSRNVAFVTVDPDIAAAQKPTPIALLAGGQVKDDSAALLADLPPPVSPDETLPDDVPPVTPPEPPKLPPARPEIEKFPNKLGVNDGTGIGSHRAEGDQPLKARNADSDQPFLSRDPRGPGGVGDPSESIQPPGQNGAGGSAGGAMPQEQITLVPAPPKAMPKLEDAEEGAYRPGPIVVKIPTRDDGVESDAPKIDEAVTNRGPLSPARAGVNPDLQETGPDNGAIREANNLVAPLRSTLSFPPPPAARMAMSPAPAPPPLRLPAVVVAPISPEPPAVATAKPTQPQQQVGEGPAGLPGPTTPPADMAQQSESEVDPFSKIEAIIRRDGKVDPQFGREVKTVRPKIPIVGMIDAYSGARAVTLKVRIEPDGRVRSVNVFKSSGSNEIDQPCLVAMYEWWFEPLKDKRGVAVPDTILFTLNFR